MNQNFSFMEQMVDKILSKEKFITNRAYSDFRNKCDVGDIMHLFTGMRTPKCQKIGDARVIEKVYWDNQGIPPNEQIADYNIAPIHTLSWAKFAQVDGFDNYHDFLEYFKHKRYGNGILCYRFELIENNKEIRK